MRRSVRSLAMLVASAVLALTLGQDSVHAAVTERQSVDPVGLAANGPSFSPSISWKGNWVGFLSDASNLVAGDTNNSTDAFLRGDRVGTPTTQRLSVVAGSPLIEASAPSLDVRTSADGSLVLFSSHATNLAAAANNGVSNVFVQTRTPGTPTLVSAGFGGAPANGASRSPAISVNNQFVAFSSYATNLTPSPTNGASQIFVRNQTTGTTELVSVDASGNQATADSFTPALSTDGRYVAFASDASNLVAGDTNGAMDIFVRDRTLATTELVSVGLNGAPANGDSHAPAINADGSIVAFQSIASNLVAVDGNNASDIFARTRGVTPTTELVSVDASGVQADGASQAPAISADGRFVAFASAATNLVGAGNDTNGFWDVFVRDRATVTPGPLTYRVSVDNHGAQANGDSGVLGVSISADGRFVAFQSDASNLVSGDARPGDTASLDIFVTDTDTDGDGYSDTLEVLLGKSPATYCAIMRADVTGDGQVSIGDLIKLAQVFGQAIPPAPPRYDQNGDGHITIGDIAKQQLVFGQHVTACP